MGYHVDMDEYSEAQLTAELERRANARAMGHCDYCGRVPTEPPCKFPMRHGDARIIAFKRDIPYKPATTPLWAVVDVDNFANENSSEHFVENTDDGVTEEVAKRIAASHNDRMTEGSPRYWRVVRLPYKLAPGFQP